MRSCQGLSALCRTMMFSHGLRVEASPLVLALPHVDLRDINSPPQRSASRRSFSLLSPPSARSIPSSQVICSRQAINCRTVTLAVLQLPEPTKLPVTSTQDMHASDCIVIFVRVIYNALRIAFVTSSVVDFPPKSGVRCCPSRRTASTAALMRAAGSTKSSEESKRAADLRISAQLYPLIILLGEHYLPDGSDGVGDTLALDVRGGAVHPTRQPTPRRS